MIDQAIEWVRRHTVPGEGIIIHSRKPVCYPEVTGYYIPTLLHIGERDRAMQFARWLVSVQQEDGSFHGAGETSGYAFDTGQIVRGWVAALPHLPELERPLRRACDWLLATADPGTGRLCVPPAGRAWSLGTRGEVNEGIHLYSLGPIQECGRLLSEARYTQFVQRSRDYYLSNVDLTHFDRPNALSHFYAYIQEALVELDCHDEARRGMESISHFQQDNGAVPGYSNVTWVCSTGLAQLAKVWYALGDVARADKALEFLASLQNPSGGFFGSYGVSANYFPAAEISWAVKYTIDATQAQISNHFDTTAPIYKTEIPEEDGRVQATLRHFGDLNGKRVLDAGCGKGRYTRVLQRAFPRAEITALDISGEMLSHLPQGVRPVLGSLLQLPLADGTFDAVLCAEALEHAVNIEAAVGELARVLAPGGRLAIIDKNIEKVGTLKMPAWEKWFRADDLLECLRAQGLEASVTPVSYEKKTHPDGLFLCWTATRNGQALANGEPTQLDVSGTRAIPAKPNPIWRLAFSLAAVHGPRLGLAASHFPSWVQSETAALALHPVPVGSHSDNLDSILLPVGETDLEHVEVTRLLGKLRAGGCLLILAPDTVTTNAIERVSGGQRLTLIAGEAVDTCRLFSLSRSGEAS